jgi:hypothetical protein
MKPLRLAMVLVLCSARFIARAGDLPAQPAKPPAPLVTRLLFVESSLCCGREDLPALPEPFPLDGLENAAEHRDSTATDFLQTTGVKFPPGAGALYFKSPMVLGITNTPENLLATLKVLEITSTTGPSSAVRVEVRVVEYPPAVEPQLGGQTTFSALQQKLGLKPVCIGSILSGSGWRSYSVVEGVSRKRSGKTGFVNEWSPPAGSAGHYLTLEANLGPDGTIEYDVDFRFVTPAFGKVPAMRDKVETTVKSADGHIDLLKTFVVQAGDRPIRHLAILSRCEKVDTAGRTGAERGAAELPPPAEK